MVKSLPPRADIVNDPTQFQTKAGQQKTPSATTKTPPTTDPDVHYLMEQHGITAEKAAEVIAMRNADAKATVEKLSRAYLRSGVTDSEVTRTTKRPTPEPSFWNYPQLFRRKATHPADLADVIGGLPRGTELCAITLPQGLQVQALYENFVLARVFLMDGTDRDITALLPHGLFPVLLENEYLMASTDGNFDICGRLWIDHQQFLTFQQNRALKERIQYPSVEAMLYACLESGVFCSADPEQIIQLQFTPNWSYELLGGRYCGSYSDFLEILQPPFQTEELALIQPDEGGVVTAKSLSELLELYEVYLGYQDTNAFAGPRLEAFLVLRNQIHEEHLTMDDQAALLVAKLPFASQPVRAIIDAIDLEADRFGRVRPVLSVQERYLPEERFHTITLDDVKALEQRGYQPGDVVDLHQIGSIARLGRLVERSKRSAVADRLAARQLRFCHHCQEPLRVRHGQFYCLNDGCPIVTWDRLQYACSPQALHIPFEAGTLQYMVLCADDTPNTVPQLLTATPAELAKTLSGETLEEVLLAIQHIRDILEGLYNQPTLQTHARGRLLDALSIRGLYQPSILKLQHGLLQKIWHWSDLADVLTDAKLLTRLGIPRVDQHSILDHTKRRHAELVHCSKL